MPVLYKADCGPIIASGSGNGGKTYAVISSATDSHPARLRRCPRG
jgi:hypothetical protein